MTFRDPKLQQHYDKVMTIRPGCRPEQLPVLALLDAYYWFALVAGNDSPPATEALENLLSPGLRPALRAWYQGGNAEEMNPNALAFREKLSKLAGENFG